MNRILVIGHWSLVIARVLTHELLPVFLVLYPLLLLLDDVEPGIVRSIFNPHWLLLAIVGLGTLSAQGDGVGQRSSIRSVVIIAILSAVIGGFWVWWKLHAGLLGMVVAVFAALAIVVVVVAMSIETKEREI